MSVKQISLAWGLTLPTSEKFLLIALADMANDDGTCWPGQANLARKLCVSDRTIRTLLMNLAEKQLIEIRHRPGDGDGRKTNVYTLTLEGQPEEFSDRGNRKSGTGNRKSTTGNRKPTSDKSLEESLEESSDIPSFDDFWTTWPKKVAKIDAEKAWEKLKPEEKQAAMSDDKRRKYGHVEKRHIPNPATYLNGKRWTDEIIQHNAPNQQPQQPTYTPPRTLRPEEWMPDVGEREPLSPEEYAKGKAAIDRLLRERRERQH